MRHQAIVLVALLSLTGCRDDEAEAKAAKAAEEERIEREVAQRVVAERKALAERKPLLHTVRVVGFIVLTGGAAAGLVWLRRPRGSIHAGSNTSTHQTLPPPTNDHYPVNPGRVIDLRPPSSPLNQHERRNH